MADLRTTLFVGNLSVFCSESELHDMFAPFGTILEIRMAKSEDNAKHLSYGFVKFATLESVQIAMQELQGVVVCGRPLKLGKALSRSMKKEGEETQHQPYTTASAHVTFISHQVEHLVTEESLRYLFSRFGEVVDAVLCKSNVDARQSRQSGYGFIHFTGTAEGVEAAFAAADALRDVMIDEVNYKCRVSKDLEQQLRQGEQAHPMLGPPTGPAMDHFEREMGGGFAHGASMQMGRGGYDHEVSGQHMSQYDELMSSSGAVPYQLRQQLRSGRAMEAQQQIMAGRGMMQHQQHQQPQYHQHQQQQHNPHNQHPHQHQQQYGGYVSQLLSAEEVSQRLRQSSGPPRGMYSPGGRSMHGADPRQASQYHVQAPGGVSDRSAQYPMGMPRGAPQYPSQYGVGGMDMARDDGRSMLMSMASGRGPQMRSSNQQGAGWSPYQHQQQGQQQYSQSQHALPQWQQNQNQRQQPLFEYEDKHSMSAPYAQHPQMESSLGHAVSSYHVEPPTDFAPQSLMQFGGAGRVSGMSAEREAGTAPAWYAQLSQRSSAGASMPEPPPVAGMWPSENGQLWPSSTSGMQSAGYGDIYSANDSVLGHQLAPSAVSLGLPGDTDTDIPLNGDQIQLARSH